MIIEMNVKAFFDKPAVTDALSKTEVKVMSRQGAYVRKTARQSIRRRRKSASPGQPPSAHGDDIKRILFQYEKETHSVVVGFVKYNAKHSTGTSMTVPELLENGGRAILWRDGKEHQWHAFPTMQPALQENAPKFAEMWKGEF